MHHWRPLLGAIAMTLNACSATGESAPQLLKFKTLSSLPDKVGFAGMFGGISHGAVIAAGGANFPGALLWEGGKKQWHDRIFVLESPEGAWKVLDQKLPRPLAYGVSVSYRERLICIGGDEYNEPRSEVFAIEYRDGAAVISLLPELPGPLTMACGALIGSTVYVAGGLGEQGTAQALNVFYSMDLAAKSPRWQALPAWPGPGRHLAIPGVSDGTFCLIGGVELEKGDDGKPRPKAPYLADAYQFAADREGKGTWRRLSDAPRPLAAAPSAAGSMGGGGLLILGGVDGSTNHMEISQRPPVSSDVFVYDARKDSWKRLENLPQELARVAAPMVRYRSGWVVISGEPSASRRTPAVHWIGVGAD